jgi:hypothetical protein
MIDPRVVQAVDEILDGLVSDQYKGQPLAQDWARVAKIQEECGEAIAELILATGQNPRKPLSESEQSDAFQRLLMELADTAMTAVYAIQHFTKNPVVTAHVLMKAQTKHITRLSAIDRKEGVNG